jgi:hypothetical protein
MAKTHKITYTLNRGTGGTNPSAQSIITSEGHIEDSVSIPVQADKEVAVAFALADLKSIMVFVTGNLTLETNSGSAADNTFALKTDEPLIWNNKMKCANPFDEDVTAFFFTNATASPVTVDIYILLDVTP